MARGSIFMGARSIRVEPFDEQVLLGNHAKPEIFEYLLQQEIERFSIAFMQLVQKWVTLLACLIVFKQKE